ncbi:hypothetical protein BWZ22_07005 [Seonamhaeicola sp. S2-3]|nr:hypothetical protein BWZ22_07005 [Seonamhaeicola sp. S2-3]
MCKQFSTKLKRINANNKEILKLIYINKKHKNKYHPLYKSKRKNKTQNYLMTLLAYYLILNSFGLVMERKNLKKYLLLKILNLQVEKQERKF